MNLQEKVKGVAVVSQGFFQELGDSARKMDFSLYERDGFWFSSCRHCAWISKGFEEQIEAATAWAYHYEHGDGCEFEQETF